MKHAVIFYLLSIAASSTAHVGISPPSIRDVTAHSGIQIRNLDGIYPLLLRRAKGRVSPKAPAQSSRSGQPQSTKSPEPGPSRATGTAPSSPPVNTNRRTSFTEMMASICDSPTGSGHGRTGGGSGCSSPRGAASPRSGANPVSNGPSSFQVWWNAGQPRRSPSPPAYGSADMGNHTGARQLKSKGSDNREVSQLWNEFRAPSPGPLGLLPPRITKQDMKAIGLDPTSDIESKRSSPAASSVSGSSRNRTWYPPSRSPPKAPSDIVSGRSKRSPSPSPSPSLRSLGSGIFGDSISGHADVLAVGRSPSSPYLWFGSPPASPTPENLSPDRAEQPRSPYKFAPVKLRAQDLRDAGLQPGKDISSSPSSPTTPRSLGGG